MQRFGKNKGDGVRECNEGANRKKGQERRGRNRRKWKRRDEGVKKRKDRTGGKGAKGERSKQEETEEEGELRVEKERSEEEETEEEGGQEEKLQPKCSKSTIVRFFRYKCALVQILVQQRLSHSSCCVTVVQNLTIFAFSHKEVQIG